MAVHRRGKRAVGMAPRYSRDGTVAYPQPYVIIEASILTCSMLVVDVGKLIV
jgi:hypothetical protein